MTTKEYTVPWPLASTVSQSKEWHWGRRDLVGGADRRSFAALNQELSFLESFPEKRLSSLTPGAGRLIFAAAVGAGSAFCTLAGRNLKTRNISWPTFSSSPPGALIEKYP